MGEGERGEDEGVLVGNWFMVVEEGRKLMMVVTQPLFECCYILELTSRMKNLTSTPAHARLTRKRKG